MSINLDEITRALEEADSRKEWKLVWASPAIAAHAPEWLRLLVEQNKGLLARNEELQRRVDALTDAAKRCSYHVAKRMNDLARTEMGEHYGPFKEVKADYVALMNAIDANEQDEEVEVKAEVERE